MASSCSSGSGRYKRAPNSVAKEIVKKENSRHTTKKSNKTKKNKK